MHIERIPCLNAHTQYLYQRIYTHTYIYTLYMTCCNTNTVKRYYKPTVGLFMWLSCMRGISSPKFRKIHTK